MELFAGFGVRGEFGVTCIQSFCSSISLFPLVVFCCSFYLGEYFLFLGPCTPVFLVLPFFAGVNCTFGVGFLLLVIRVFGLFVSFDLRRLGLLGVF
ncbi:hypothetical protein [Bacteroides graminisolvens]|uniref:hypothetical protein n=1 Tax=Bacteroides graminisolvens TaxID=477666 RepID=UPI0012B52F19|nr:hypothetical protein [Bacteroides graminisolvens]